MLRPICFIFLKFVLENIFDKNIFENTKNTVLVFSKNCFFFKFNVFYVFLIFQNKKKEKKKSNMFLCDVF